MMTILQRFFRKKTATLDTRIKVMTVDDHTIFRTGVKTALSKRTDINMIGEAIHGQDMFDKLKHLKPDIILLGIMMPVMDGFAALPLLRKKYPGIKVIMLSMNNDPVIIRRMLEMGARSYLTKEAGAEMIYETLLAVHQKWFHINENVVKGVTAQPHIKVNISDPTNKKIELSAKEIEILKLLAAEKSTKEIADEIDISPRTTEVIINKLKDKVGVKSKAGLQAFTVKNL